MRQTPPAIRAPAPATPAGARRRSSAGFAGVTPGAAGSRAGRAKTPAASCGLFPSARPRSRRRRTAAGHRARGAARAPVPWSPSPGWPCSRQRPWRSRRADGSGAGRCRPGRQQPAATAHRQWWRRWRTPHRRATACFHRCPAPRPPAAERQSCAHGAACADRRQRLPPQRRRWTRTLHAAPELRPPWISFHQPLAHHLHLICSHQGWRMAYANKLHQPRARAALGHGGGSCLQQHIGLRAA